MTINFSGLPFATHRVQYTAGLVNAIWTNAITVSADALGGFTFVDTNAPLTPRRFYRAVSP
jgi:hypothetical protein